MFFKKPDPNNPQRRTPPWFKWLILGFFAYALVVNVVRDKDTPTVEAEKQTDHSAQGKTGAQALSETVRNSFDLENFMKKAFPTFKGLPMKREDIKPGRGPEALCGQRAEVRYVAKLADGTEFESNKNDAEPLRFLIGARKANRVVEEGVEGMRAGALRQLTVQAEYGLDREKHPDLKAPDGSKVIYDVELLSLNPEVPDAGMHPRFVDTKSGDGDPARCGDSVKLNLVLWNSDGIKGFSTENREPLALTLGAGKEAVGLENGIIGMRPGGLRTLILPPSYHKRLDNQPGETVPMNGAGIVAVDVELLPEKPANNPQ